MPEFIEVHFENGVGRIVLSREEKRNALKREFIQELNQAVDDLSANPELRVLEFSARGSVFCAGMDLGQMKSRAESESGPAELQKDSEVYCELLKKIFALSVPTVAKLQGPVLAGGVGLVLACDLVVASENVFFMLPEPVRGITAAMVTPFLIYRVGNGPANYMLLSGERLSASAALRTGLCHDVVLTEALNERADSLIAAILTGAPSALAITKRHAQDCAFDVHGLVEKSIEVSAKARETADAQEGLTAFLEKRKPNWQS